MKVILTDQFLTRVEECTDYIALDHIPTAIQWAEGVFEHCEKLRTQPDSRRMVTEFIRPEIKELIHGNYRLVYELKPKQVDVFTIWHKSQVLPKNRINGWLTSASTSTVGLELLAN